MSRPGIVNRLIEYQPDPLGLVFQDLPPAIQSDVYLRQRALVPGTPDWELETWPWKLRNPAR